MAMYSPEQCTELLKLAEDLIKQNNIDTNSRKSLVETGIAAATKWLIRTTAGNAYLSEHMDMSLILKRFSLTHVGNYTLHPGERITVRDLEFDTQTDIECRNPSCSNHMRPVWCGNAYYQNGTVRNLCNYCASIQDVEHKKGASLTVCRNGEVGCIGCAYRNTPAATLVPPKQEVSLLTDNRREALY